MFNNQIISSMKKVFSLFAILSVLAFSCFTMTSCQEEVIDDMLYHVDTGDFFDNMDLLTSSIDVGFEKAGFERVGAHYWKLRGNKAQLNKKAKEVFQNRCKEIDKDRSQILLPLALKGVTIKLRYDAVGEKDVELDSYTFVEQDM